MAEQKITPLTKFIEKIASIAAVVFALLHLYSMGTGIVQTLGEMVLPTLVEELSPDQAAAFSLHTVYWSQEHPNLPMSPRSLQETRYVITEVGLEASEKAAFHQGMVPRIGSSRYASMEVVSLKSPREVVQGFYTV
jgi:hypothetical protein